MSHIHLPDGVIPLWLCAIGWVLALAVLYLSSAILIRTPRARRNIPLVAAVSALVLVAMSIEILPLAYHVNLTVVAGILLGPLLIPLAGAVIELMLSLLGHGGMTVLGVNYLILCVEMYVGWMIFALAKRWMTSDTASIKTIHPRRASVVVAIATIVALALSTTCMIAAVWTAGPELGHVAAEHSHESSAGGSLDITTFVITAFTLGPFGWALEAFLGANIVAYIARVRPSLLRLSVTKSTVDTDDES